MHIDFTWLTSTRVHVINVEHYIVESNKQILAYIRITLLENMLAEC